MKKEMHYKNCIILLIWHSRNSLSPEDLQVAVSNDKVISKLYVIYNNKTIARTWRTYEEIRTYKSI